MTARDRFDDLQYGIVSFELDSLRKQAAAERRANARKLAARKARDHRRRERHVVLRLLPVLKRARPLA